MPECGTLRAIGPILVSTNPRHRQQGSDIFRNRTGVGRRERGAINEHRSSTLCYVVRTGALLLYKGALNRGVDEEPKV